MKSYLVILKSYAEKTIAAYDYTEDTQGGRIYFHKTKGKSDRKTFFVTAWVAAILEIPKEETLEAFRNHVRDAKN